MNSKIIGLTAFFIILSSATQAQSIVINGIIKDYKWAHHSNKLAILYEDHLSILEPANSKFIKDIDSLSYYSSLEWTGNDIDFMLGDDNIVYQYIPEKDLVKEFIKFDGCGSTWNINGIAVNPNSKYWACISSCEGFPCLHICYSNKEIKNMDFGVAASSKLFFKNDSIVVCIDPYSNSDGDPEVYIFCPPDYKSFKASDNNYPKDISFDDMFIVIIERNENETSTITITKSDN